MKRRTRKKIRGDENRREDGKNWVKCIQNAARKREIERNEQKWGKMR